MGAPQAIDVDVQLVLDAVSAVALHLGREAGSEAPDPWPTFMERLREHPESRFARLVERFRLGAFELRCVSAALAFGLDPTRWPDAHLAEGVRELRLTVSHALEWFCPDVPTCQAALAAFQPDAPLARGGLLFFPEDDGLGPLGVLGRRLALSAPVLRYLLGERDLTPSLRPFARLELPAVSLLNVVLPREQIEQVRELVELHRSYRRVIGEWGFDHLLPYGRGLTLLFSGVSGTGKTLLAQALATHARRPLLTVNAADLPGSIDGPLRDVFAEAALRDAIVLIDECEALFAREDRRRADAYHIIEEFDGILFLVTSHPEQLDDALERRIIYRVPLEPPDTEARRQIWEVHLPPEVPIDGDIDLDQLASSYDFTGGTIKNAILIAVNRAIAKNPRAPRLTMELLRNGCGTQLRYALEALAVRSSTHLRMADIVLPPETERKVREIIAACRNQAFVLNRWGFGRRLVTGKGITALFDGAPGTGKTLCAEIIAGEFDRPLYRVNLPEVVSKWVGETEKHIRAIFQQARVSHAMLLFDEADALFASRVAEPQTSTDRYANMEVNLLLQEIERFPGVCILTTNSFGALDKALVRRIQFRVTFEEPDIEQRQRIWQVIRPQELPLAADVDFAVFAKKYELTGAMIKNALLRAAYWACEQKSIVTTAILHDACLDEYKAAGKVTRDAAVVAAEPPPPRLRGRR
jgi:SpoVK/Ycf46/Vps4 family AAA+-type ATPase